jgi:hypothetical protein
VTRGMEPSDLYGLPLEQFTQRRNALARELRGSGEREEASRVSKLRKPSVAAWAVNQLIRTQKRDINAMFKAGDELVRVQADLLAGGGDRGSLRKTVEAERTAVDALVNRARGLLSAGGAELSAGAVEQVRDTLHAAALDEDARAQVSAGCLERELRHVGLGSLASGPAPVGGAAPARPAGAKSGRPDAARKRAEAAAARRAATQAQRRLERAVREVAAAERRRHLAGSKLQEAEDALAAAQSVHDEAVRENERAQRALNEPRP